MKAESEVRWSGGGCGWGRQAYRLGLEAVEGLLLSFQPAGVLLGFREAAGSLRQGLRFEAWTLGWGPSSVRSQLWVFSKLLLSSKL